MQRELRENIVNTLVSSKVFVQVLLTYNLADQTKVFCYQDCCFDFDSGKN